MEDKINNIKQKIIDTYVEYNDSLKRAEVKKQELEALKERLKVIIELKNKENK